MIPHIHTLFEFISILYENQHQTLNIKKIDRGQIKFREYSITLLQPKTLYKLLIYTCPDWHYVLWCMDTFLLNKTKRALSHDSAYANYIGPLVMTDAN